MLPEKGNRNGNRHENGSGNGSGIGIGTNTLPDAHDGTSSNPNKSNEKITEEAVKNETVREEAHTDANDDKDGQDSPTKSPQARNVPVVQQSMSSSPSYTSQGKVDDMIPRVSSMRSDFHFYAEDNKQVAFLEIQQESSSKDPIANIAKLNERLLRMWEGEPNKRRNDYMMKEEMDRTRFMNEDEIESRHCATLTSRPKPYMHMKLDKAPKQVGEEESKGKKRQDAEEAVEKDDVEDYESPTKKLKEVTSVTQEEKQDTAPLEAEKEGVSL